MEIYGNPWAMSTRRLSWRSDFSTQSLKSMLCWLSSAWFRSFIWICCGRLKPHPEGLVLLCWPDLFLGSFPRFRSWSKFPRFQGPKKRSRRPGEAQALAGYNHWSGDTMPFLFPPSETAPRLPKIIPVMKHIECRALWCHPSFPYRLPAFGYRSSWAHPNISHNTQDISRIWYC